MARGRIRADCTPSRHGVDRASNQPEVSAEPIEVDRILERKGWCRRPVLVAAAAVGLVAVVAAGAALVTGASGGRRVRVHAEHLGIGVVERGLFQEWLAVTGTIVPVTTHHLDAGGGGRVEAIYREAGNLVAAGDSILKLANADLELGSLTHEAELFQRENDLRAARAAMEQSARALRREALEVDLAVTRQERLVATREKLLEAGLIARQPVAEAREELACLRRTSALLAAAQEQDSLFRAEQARRIDDALTHLRASAQVIRRSLDDLVIRAPVAGQLTALAVEIGQSLAAGERVGQIDVLAGFKVRASIGEHYVARLTPGQVGSLDLGGRTHALVVEKVYPEVAGGRFEIDLRFAGPEPPGLRRGQTMPLRIELGEAHEALLLACGGFLQDTGGRWVFVLDSSGGSARRREVSLGRRNGTSCEVLAGLAAGERVVISPYEPFAGAEQLIVRR